MNKGFEGDFGEGERFTGEGFWHFTLPQSMSGERNTKRPPCKEPVFWLSLCINPLHNRGGFMPLLLLWNTGLKVLLEKRI